MSNDESVLREVDQELAADQQSAFLQKNGPLLIGVGAAIVMAVAALQFVEGRSQSQQNSAAQAYYEMSQQMADQPEQAYAILEGFIADTTPGYAVLAKMELAARYAPKDHAKAITIYQEVADSSAAPLRLRQMAQLRAAYLALEDGRDQTLAILGNLIAEKGPYGYYAREIEALAALKAKDYAAASVLLEQVASDANAPVALQARAREMAALAAAGAAGVDLSTELQLEDLGKTLSTMSDALEAEAADTETPDTASTATEADSADQPVETGEDEHAH